MDSWFNYINENPDKLCSYKYLSDNPNITWEIAESKTDSYWDYDFLSSNPMFKNPHF